MLEVWKLYGDTFLGQPVLPARPEYIYEWSTTINGEIEESVCSIGEYLCPHAVPGLWNTWDLVVALAILNCELSVDPEREWDMLYVGGGSGRFHNATAAWTPPRKCFCIDKSAHAVELMELRGVPCELMDGHDMSGFDDSSFPLVVLSPWSLDSSTDPETLVAEAARVASAAVIVSGRLIDYGDETPTTYTDTMTNWQGETQDRVGTARHHDHVLGMFAAEGMSPLVARTFLPLAERPNDPAWLIEVRF